MVSVAFASCPALLCRWVTSGNTWYLLNEQALPRSAPADCSYEPIATQVIGLPPSYHHSAVLPSMPLSEQRVQAQFQIPSKKEVTSANFAVISRAAATAIKVVGG